MNLRPLNVILKLSILIKLQLWDLKMHPLLLSMLQLHDSMHSICIHFSVCPYSIFKGTNLIKCLFLSLHPGTKKALHFFIYIFFIFYCSFFWCCSVLNEIGKLQVIPLFNNKKRKGQPYEFHAVKI